MVLSHTGERVVPHRRLAAGVAALVAGLSPTTVDACSRTATSLVLDPPDGRIPKVNFRGSSDSLHRAEKLRRVADDTVEYSVTIDNPTVWSRPWTVMIPPGRTGEDMFKDACHEGNYGLPAILRGARAQKVAARP